VGDFISLIETLIKNIQYEEAMRNISGYKQDTGHKNTKIIAKMNVNYILKIVLKRIPGFSRIINERDQLRNRVWDLEKRIRSYHQLINEVSSIKITNTNSVLEIGKSNKEGIFENDGFCYSCNEKVKFIANRSWWRDYYRCANCNSIPRERALMYCIDKICPKWKELVIHESSPVFRGTSFRLRKESPCYIPTYYFPGVELGSMKNGYRCENLENMTFEDNSIDLHITQDVMEHVFDPKKAFQEIARTLKPGGMHIFTVPIVNKDQPTEVCAIFKDNGDVKFLKVPDYHGNPVNDQGALVVTRWGYDICDFIFNSCGLATKVINIDSLDLGIRADYNEVLITTKELV
jgi:hypothetical protein